jgi:hypothetical protein
MGGGHGGRGMAPHFSGARGPGHTFGHFDHRHDFAFRHHEFGRFRDRDFDRDDRFFRHHHDRFFFGFDFAAFGFPWWYPDYYYWYPYDYPNYGYDSYYGYGPAEIGSGSRQAIRAFQAAQRLPVTGMIDPKLLKALGIKYKTA